MAKTYTSFEDLYVKEFGGEPKQKTHVKKKTEVKDTPRFKSPRYTTCEYHEGEPLPWVFKFSATGTLARTLAGRVVKIPAAEQNGWRVSGEVHEDYYCWVNSFSAHKGNYKVEGDFEKEVRASSKAAFFDFTHSVEVREWDYMDI